jgi:hypothetical protein
LRVAGPVHEVGRAVTVAAPESRDIGSALGQGRREPAFETFFCRGAHGIRDTKPGIGEQVIDMPLGPPVLLLREEEVAFEPDEAAGPKG